MQKLIEARIAKESTVKLPAGAPAAVDPEEKKAALDAKITADIKARKELADEAIEALSAKKAAANAEDEERWRKQEDDRLNAIAAIETAIANAGVKAKAEAVKNAAQNKQYNDEQWTANMPDRLLHGYVALDDEMNDE